MQIENHKEEVPFAHYEQLFAQLNPAEAAEGDPPAAGQRGVMKFLILPMRFIRRTEETYLS